MFQLISIRGMTADTETWSGQVTKANHTGPWTEYYERAVYRTEYYTVQVSDYSTDSKGRSYRSGSHSESRSREVFDHWEPETEYHPDTWSIDTSLDFSKRIDAGLYREIVSQFGGEESHHGSRSTFAHNSHMLSGDPNDYGSVNQNNFVRPVTTWRHFENRIKAAPTTFSFKKIPVGPDGKEIPKVFEYPANDDCMASDRLLGTAASFGQLAWDQMNARLGPTRKVNVIACGFGPEADSSIAEWQKSKWIGGRKNDLVICYGGGTVSRPSWVQVFGWSDSDICKHDLETIVLDNPAVPATIPLIEAEIAKNYVKKDWHQFDYITIQPPTWSYFLFLGLMIPLQGIMWYFFMNNDSSKEDGIPIFPKRESYYVRQRKIHRKTR